MSFLTVKFLKYHALGNDYLIINPQSIKYHLTKNIIQSICDRKFGVGSDGILYGPFSYKTKIFFRIFNPDGSEAEVSGNGIRIFALHLYKNKYVKNKKFTLHTQSGPSYITIANKKQHLLKISLKNYFLIRHALPYLYTQQKLFFSNIKFADKNTNIYCVNIGNPHCVLFQHKVNTFITKKFGPLIEKNPNFPNRINVQFVEVINRNNIKVEIWERGAGYTLASGSSSAAACYVAYKLNLIEQKITAHMPGGILSIEIHNNHIYLIGTGNKIMQGRAYVNILS